MSAEAPVVDPNQEQLFDPAMSAERKQLAAAIYNGIVNGEGQPEGLLENPVVLTVDEEAALHELRTQFTGVNGSVPQALKEPIKRDWKGGENAKQYEERVRAAIDKAENSVKERLAASEAAKKEEAEQKAYLKRVDEHNQKIAERDGKTPERLVARDEYLRKERFTRGEFNFNRNIKEIEADADAEVERIFGKPKNSDMGIVDTEKLKEERKAAEPESKKAPRPNLVTKFAKEGLNPWDEIEGRTLSLSQPDEKGEIDAAQLFTNKGDTLVWNENFHTKENFDRRIIAFDEGGSAVVVIAKKAYHIQKGDKPGTVKVKEVVLGEDEQLPDATIGQSWEIKEINLKAIKQVVVRGDKVTTKLADEAGAEHIEKNVFETFEKIIKKGLAASQEEIKPIQFSPRSRMRRIMGNAHDLLTKPTAWAHLKAMKGFDELQSYLGDSEKGSRRKKLAVAGVVLGALASYGATRLLLVGDAPSHSGATETGVPFNFGGGSGSREQSLAHTASLQTIGQHAVRVAAAPNHVVRHLEHGHTIWGDTEARVTEKHPNWSQQQVYQATNQQTARILHQNHMNEQIAERLRDGQAYED